LNSIRTVIGKWEINSEEIVLNVCVASSNLRYGNILLILQFLRFLELKIPCWRGEVPWWS
jgi:hypothetical protein